MLISLIVNTDGRAEGKSIALIRSLHPLLDVEAIRFVRYAQFRVMCLDGRPVRVRGAIPVNFEIIR